VRCAGGGIWVNEDAGRLRVTDGTGHAFFVTGPINLGSWARIEWHVVNSATVGQWEVKLFNDPASTTPTESQSTAANRNTGAAEASVQFGTGSGAAYSDTFWLDNIVAGATDWVGPIVGTQILLASADSVDGAWTDQAGGSSLFAAIDEAAASDSDYIRSELNPSASGCRVKLSSGGDPHVSTDHVISWRTGKTGGATINMTVKLYQGGGDSLGGGTLIASFARDNVGALTTYEETLSGAEADSITDYTDLYLEFFADTV
jgi:hypothetical protein